MIPPPLASQEFPVRRDNRDGRSNVAATHLSHIADGQGHELDRDRSAPLVDVDMGRPMFARRKQNDHTKPVDSEHGRHNRRL
jgi:hypothetical protein